jgi:hypothetical protein
VKKLYLKDLKFILDNYSDGVEAIKDSKTTFDICYRRESVFFSNGEYQKDEKTFGYKLRIMIAYRTKCELIEFDTMKN